jgi:hypothetical protein
MALETKIKKLRKYTAQRNFFDVERYAFRIFAISPRSFSVARGLLSGLC